MAGGRRPPQPRQHQPRPRGPRRRGGRFAAGPRGVRRARRPLVARAPLRGRRGLAARPGPGGRRRGGVPARGRRGRSARRSAPRASRPPRRPWPRPWPRPAPGPRRRCSTRPPSPGRAASLDAVVDGPRLLLGGLTASRPPVASTVGFRTVPPWDCSGIVTSRSREHRTRPKVGESLSRGAGGCGHVCPHVRITVRLVAPAAPSSRRRALVVAARGPRRGRRPRRRPPAQAGPGRPGLDAPAGAGDGARLGVRRHGRRSRVDLQRATTPASASILGLHRDAPPRQPRHPIKVPWTWQGLHAWFSVTAQLQPIVNGVPVDRPRPRVLVNAGRQLLHAPSNGFLYGNVATFTTSRRTHATASGSSGSNSDSNNFLRGTFTLSTRPYIDATLGTDNRQWPGADRPCTPAPRSSDGTIEEAGEARWYKFHVVPGQKVDRDAAQPPEDYDLALYGDIGDSFDRLSNGAEPGRARGCVRQRRPAGEHPGAGLRDVASVPTSGDAVDTPRIRPAGLRAPGLRAAGLRAAGLRAPGLRAAGLRAPRLRARLLRARPRRPNAALPRRLLRRPGPDPADGVGRTPVRRAAARWCRPRRATPTATSTSGCRATTTRRSTRTRRST